MLNKVDILFYIAIIFFIFSIIIEMTEFATDREGQDIQMIFTVTKLMRYFSYALCVIKIMMKQKYLKIWYPTVVFIISLLFVGAAAAETKTLFLYFWFLAAAKGVQDKKIIKTSVCVQLSMLCFTIICSQTGIIEDYIYDNGVRMRHFLGFTWATTAPILFFYIILQYLYLKDMRIHAWIVVVLMTVNVWLFKMTNTKFAFLLASAILIFALFYTYTPVYKIHWKRFKYFFVLMPEIMAVFSIWLHNAYDSESPRWNQLNELLSDRLNLGYQAIQEYGFRLFGQRIEWYGVTQSFTLGQEAYNYVDCAYLQILLQFGFVALFFVLAAYSVIMWRAMKEQNYSACWILSVVLVFAITEPRLVNIAFNPFILLVMAKVDRKIYDENMNTVKYKNYGKIKEECNKLEEENFSNNRSGRIHRGRSFAMTIRVDNSCQGSWSRRYK